VFEVPEKAPPPNVDGAVVLWPKAAEEEPPKMLAEDEAAGVEPKPELPNGFLFGLAADA